MDSSHFIAYPTQNYTGNFMNPAHAYGTNSCMFNTTAVLSNPGQHTMHSHNSHANTHHIQNVANRPFTNRTTSLSAVDSQAYPMKHKRLAHLNKTKLAKRSVEPVNLQKSCPNCDRYWKYCKCSNIKNRPDPKPYCKFVPPRMLKKQA